MAKFLVPKDAPCWNCVQKIGSSVCRTQCEYWPKLNALADAGKLKKEVTA